MQCGSIYTEYNLANFYPVHRDTYDDYVCVCAPFEIQALMILDSLTGEVNQLKQR